MQSVPDAKDYHVISIPGELDLYNAEKLKETIGCELENESRPLIFDFSDLSYIDSSGIGVLLFIYGRLSKKTQPFCFANIRCYPSRNLTHPRQNM
jgi:anti-anti-sigma factor